MAIDYGDGKAGQYAKSQAQNRFDRFLGILFYSLALISLLLGMILGFMLASGLAAHFQWARRANSATLFWIPLSAEIVLIVATLFFARALRRPMQGLVRERLKWLRGGQTEGLVAWRLRDLGDEWHLFNNVELKTGGDLDHVLVGPGGVFCLSTKSNKGLYTVTSDGKYLLNGQVTDHLSEARTLALKLRNWLEVKLHDNPDVRTVPFVQPILVAPFAYIDFQSRQETACVLDEDGVFEMLNDSRKQLTPHAVRASVKALQEMTGRQPKEKNVAVAETGS